MKIYEFRLRKSYSGGVALIAAFSLEEAKSIMKANGDDSWGFYQIVEHLSSSLKEPQLIIINSYIQ